MRINYTKYSSKRGQVSGLRLKAASAGLAFVLLGFTGTPPASAMNSVDREAHTETRVKNQVISIVADIVSSHDGGPTVLLLTHFFEPVLDSVVILAGLEVQADPYFALHLDITNKTDQPLQIETTVFSPTVPVLTPLPPMPPFAMFQGQFSFDLYDANGDGSAFYGGGLAQFSLLDSVNSAGLPVTPTFPIETYAVGMNAIPSVGPMPVPPSFTGQWDTIGFFHTGSNFLSAHDRVVLKAFGCVALPGGDPCPTPPDLSALVVPEPSNVWLFVAGLGAVISFARLRRRGLKRG